MFGDGMITGIGWALGVTIGFVLISTVLVIVLKALGGTPLVGGWVAGIVESTIEQLAKRTPLTP